VGSSEPTGTLHIAWTKVTRSQSAPRHLLRGCVRRQSWAR